jgi:hypothetical protein
MFILVIDEVFIARMMSFCENGSGVSKASFFYGFESIFDWVEKTFEKGRMSDGNSLFKNLGGS